MAIFLGFGDGHNNSPSSASGVINSYASATGTAGNTTVTSGLTVSIGDLVFLHNTQNANIGSRELVKVTAVGSGSFNVTPALTNSYISGAQAVLVPQYTDGTLSNAITSTAWQGSYGGIIVLAVNGKLTLTGSLNVNGAGFRGGNAITGAGNTGRQGEGEDGNAQALSINAQGNGGGGGGNGAVGSQGRGTGGGLNQGGVAGYGGDVAGASDASLVQLGGGGGSGGMGTGNTGTSGAGARGAGMIIIYAKSIDTSGGYCYANGSTGSGCVYPLGAGGGGAGGTILVFTENGVFGTGRLQANGGRGGCVANNCADRVDGRGGCGGGGRIMIYSCSETGTVLTSGNSYASVDDDPNPTSSDGTQDIENGGQDFCAVTSQVL